MNGRLTRLLCPRSVAVIGGGTWGGNVIRACRDFGFAGDLWAVHPTRRDLAGCAAVPSVRDLPRPPDAAFVGVNRAASIGITRDLAAIGAGGAVCFASGFREAAPELNGAHDLQDQLVAAAGNMPLLGPNCYGLINALEGAALWPDQHGLVPVDRGVAIIAQSSNIALNLTMQRRGLPIACLVTVGNQAQTGLSQIGAALLADDRITAIGLYIEGLDDLAAFQDFARAAAARGKPVAVLKVGASQAAQEAALSHTAALAGSMAGATALFARLGVAQVHSLPALIEALKILHLAGRLPAPEIASMSCSGGEASLIADMALGGPVRFPALAPAQIRHLRGILGPKVALANPLDYHTYIWGDVDAMAATFAAMMAGGAALGVVVLDLPRADRCQPDDWQPTIHAVKRARVSSGAPFAVLATLPEGLPEPVAADLMAAGIIPLCGLAEGLAAIAAAATPPPDLKRARLAPPARLAAPRLLDEATAKARLAAQGLRLPRRQIAEGAQAAARAAAEIGFPVALKGLGLAHKTEAGAVVLNLNTPEAVSTAANAMPVGRFLVEEMITGILAELLIGIVNDPAHGRVLTLAAGGVLTELMQDSTALLLPATRAEIRARLAQLRYARVLAGHRGAPPCDISAITDAVLALQSYALAHPVAELEVNPLLCGADFAIAADALIKTGGKDAY